MLETMISSRMALKEDAKPDFYSVAAGHLDLGSADIQNSELWAEATFFITAGGTPPATTMITFQIPSPSSLSAGWHQANPKDQNSRKLAAE
ncbi:hypothetical protein SLS62_001969 [Diatrype stigma]|uniref:Uncharacterized protein n=1 Tax=Diatrype stigma TaxID=117547 RepID=A0AAN9UY28_9PEZI